MADLDVLPIIPDEPRVRKEPYNLALTKLLRANDHKILGSYVKFAGSTIRIEIDLQSDPDLVDKLQAMKDLEIKEDPLYKYRQEAENFMSRIREREHEPLRYQGDTPF